MRHVSSCASLAGAVVALAVSVAAVAAGQNSGAIEQTIPPPVSQNPALPPLHLTDDQRAKIRQVLNDANTEVQFSLKSNKPAQSFEPSVGAKIPAGLKPHTLPPPLLDEMPVLKRYSYLKFKHQVLIVDPLSRKVVDMFAEASG